MEVGFRMLLTPSMMGLAALLAGSFIVVISVFGPYGSFSTTTLLQRFVLVAPVLILELLICYPAFVVTLYLVRVRSQVVVFLALAATVLVLAAACTTISYTAVALYRTYDLATTPEEVDLFVAYRMCVVLLMCPTVIMYYVLYQRATRLIVFQELKTRGEPEDSPQHVRGDAPARKSDASAPRSVREDTTTPDSPFYARVPREIGHDVTCLKTSGHYLEVTTGAGTATILLRMRDAIAELGELGMQVHRSYWVAHEHVVGVRRDGRRAYVRLSNDHEVPVSRSLLPAVLQRHAELTHHTSPVYSESRPVG